MSASNGQTGATATRSFVIGGARTHRGALLRAVQQAMRTMGTTMRDVADICVVTGPGRFSTVRLGVATANALAWALGVPLVVRGRRVRIAVPEYGAEPSITRSRTA